MEKETEIKELFKVNEIRKIHCIHLIDLGGEIDEDGDELPIVADTIEIKDGEVFIYDQMDITEKGVPNPIWKLRELDESIKASTLWEMKETLKYLDKPYEL